MTSPAKASPTRIQFSAGAALDEEEEDDEEEGLPQVGQLRLDDEKEEEGRARPPQCTRRIIIRAHRPVRLRPEEEEEEWMHHRAAASFRRGSSGERARNVVLRRVQFEKNSSPIRTPFQRA